MKTMIVYNRNIAFVARRGKKEGISGKKREQEGIRNDKLSKIRHKLPTHV